MAIRHWHWRLRIEGYHGAFEYQSQADAEDAMWRIVDGRVDERDCETYEVPCTCGEPILIGPKEKS
jgi:hypothetical protein